MAETLKILFVCEYGSVNGGENSLLSVVPHLLSGGCQVFVAAPNPSPLQCCVVATGAEFCDFQVVCPISQQRHSSEKITSILKLLIEKIQPEIIHANSLSASRIVARMAPQSKVPLFGHIRDIMRISKKAINDLNQLDRILCVSHAVKEWFAALGIGESKLVVIHNGIDLQTFGPRKPTGWLHQQLGIEQNNLIILSVGQIGIRKGLDVTMAALIQLVESSSCPDFHWVIVGERYSTKQESIEYEKQLQSVCDSSPLASRVHFVGRSERVAEMMNECTLLVHAARQEPLGRVLLEAAASGLPVIASDVGGTSEIFTHGQNGILFESGNSLELMGSIADLLQNSSKRTRLAAAARVRIESAFDAKVAAGKLLASYATIPH